MKKFLLGLGTLWLVLTPILMYIHSFEALKKFVDLSVYTVLMFSILGFIIAFLLERSLLHPKKQIFISLTLANMFVKMFFSILFLLLYYEFKRPQSGNFVLPFIIIYVMFTTYETWYLVKLSDSKP